MFFIRRKKTNLPLSTSSKIVSMLNALILDLEKRKLKFLTARAKWGKNIIKEF